MPEPALPLSPSTGSPWPEGLLKLASEIAEWLSRPRGTDRVAAYPAAAMPRRASGVRLYAEGATMRATGEITAFRSRMSETDAVRTSESR
jgi:hypothetical protein